MTRAARVLLVELPGASVGLLQALAAAGTMPTVGAVLEDAAVERLRSEGFTSAAAAWATLHCGGGPERHGLLDESCLDRRGRWLRPVSRRPLPCPALADLLIPAVRLPDLTADGRLWRAKPDSFDELAAGVGRTTELIRLTADAAEEAGRRRPWRLLSVRFGVLDPMLHRLWSTLGIGGRPGGNRAWVAKCREAFSALEVCLGRLFDLAAGCGAAVVLASPFGFGPFRGKITVNEVLHRRGLLHVASGTGQVGYRLYRFGWKARRALLGDGGRRPVRAWLPVDWNKSRAVALHGQSAALVYLNTPERFGTCALAASGKREQAALEAVAALAEARHPATGEPLFVDVFCTADRYACNPIARGLPEVVGIPAPGFLVRHRLDRNGQVMRTDATLAATRSREGTLIVHAPGRVMPGEFTGKLTDAAAAVLRAAGHASPSVSPAACYTS